ncbi:MAG: twin-arginine translocase TatA/TatE family subunit [Pseudomonadota bacterium]
MFGIGLPELILIMALALIVVGPDKLPDLAKSLAKQFLELKKTANALKDSLQEEMKEAERPWEQLKPLSDEDRAALPGAEHVRDEVAANENAAVEGVGEAGEVVYQDDVNVAASESEKTGDEAGKKS